MRRTFLLGIFATACATTTAIDDTPSSQPEANPHTVTADSSTEGAAKLGMDPTLVQAAMGASKIDKIKLRIDEDGSFVKQAVYHDNAAAIPEVVKAKALEVFPGAKIVFYESEHYADAGVVHEVEVETTDGRHCEVSATPDGTLRYQECHLDPAKLPAPVAAKIAELYPSAKILEAEHKQGPSIDALTVEVEDGGREFYVQLSPAGEVQSIHLRVKAIVEIPQPIR